MSSNLDFQLAKNAADYQLAFPLIRELNPKLSKEKFIEHTQHMLSLGNYYLYLAFQNEKMIGICGYWIATKYYCGKYLEIDNFIIDAAYRSKNYGSEFLSFIENVAHAQKCDTIMLDAYVENFAGHRFYYKNGFIARGYHFLKQL